MVYADGVLLSHLLGNGAAFTPRRAMVTPGEIDRVGVLHGPFSAAHPGNSVGAVVDFVTRMPQRFEAHAKLGFSQQDNALYGRGGVAGQSPRQQDGTLIGSSTNYSTVQDHLKAKLAWDTTPTLRAHFLLGQWHNQSDGRSITRLHDASGAAVNSTFGGDISQPVAIRGKRDTLLTSDFSKTRDGLDHGMQAMSLRSRTQGVFDWTLAASVYRYQKDLARPFAPTRQARPLAGRLTDGTGTGWATASATGLWRPRAGAGEPGQHTVDFGLAQDRYRLRSRVHDTADWLAGDALGFASRFAGQTATQSAFAQDTSLFAPAWATVLGLRAEHWAATGGVTESADAGAADAGACRARSPVCTLLHPGPSANVYSPKAARSHALTDDWVVKAGTGRAIRWPTVSELHQGGVNPLGQAINNKPALRPERSQTTELSAEWTVPGASMRSTPAHHRAGFGRRCVGRLDRRAARRRWRATAVATWQATPQRSIAGGARYSGPQYSALDNGDPNGFAHLGASPSLTTDLRLRDQIDRQWSAAFGIDNLNNLQDWNFHPYPQRSLNAELKFDL